MGLRSESMMMMTMMRSNIEAKLKEIGSDDMINNLQDKQKGLTLMVENFGWSFTGWLDEVFPPEKRKDMLLQLQHWIHIIAPFVVMGFVLLALFWCCGRCILCGCKIILLPLFWCCKLCILCCCKIISLALFWCKRCILCCCKIKAAKMMKAPGRDFRMPRHVFETNPKGYFRDLRATKFNY
ncbi:hypothetical protein ACH5RR_030418 [Cinchona calisaya]|uniref:Uncharacterized protein n=1 Tax=Cinchona calisaya TaxID=153742 RepID=A0ABD2YUJ6_9GENT